MLEAASGYKPGRRYGAYWCVGYADDGRALFISNGSVYVDGLKGFSPRRVG
jgi:hypothetical protein